VTVVAAPDLGAAAAIVAFTGHHVVAAAVPAEWVEERCPRWAFEAPFGSGFVGELGARPGESRLQQFVIILKI
jgi:hypothetical protein